MNELGSRGRRVLLADDDDLVRGVARAVLVRAGLAVTEACDGLDAISKFRELRDEVALVVLDVVMPGMGGPQVAAQIRELRPRTPILFLSGFDPARASQAMCVDEKTRFLSKPYRAAELVAEVARLLAARGRSPF